MPRNRKNGFRYKTHRIVEDISVSSEFVEKEIKYVSNSFKKYAESVAKSCFSKSEIPDVVNSIVEQILHAEILPA
ncbi:MAG: hypothetical protein J6S86_04560 [Alphaproteobacteria bacterium]|nr:hypothetical protein [Alphaproteobacteria bacterium]